MTYPIDGIFGVQMFLGKNYTMSEIHSALVLGIFDLRYFDCSMDGLMYQTGSPCVSCGDKYFGLL